MGRPVSIRQPNPTLMRRGRVMCRKPEQQTTPGREQDGGACNCSVRVRWDPVKQRHPIQALPPRLEALPLWSLPSVLSSTISPVE